VPPSPSTPAAERNEPVALKRLLLEKAPLMALAAASSAVTFAVQQRGGAVGSLTAWPFGMRVTNAIAAYGIYLWKLAVPIDLAVFYPLPAAAPWGTCLLSFLCLAAISAFSIRSIKTYPFLIAGWLWYLGTLVPVIGFVQIGLQSFADRYTYLPSIGIFVMAVWGADALFDRARIAASARALSAAGIVAVASFLTWRQTGHWRNDETLYSHAIAVTAGNYVALTNLGQHYGDGGDFEKAIEYYQQATDAAPRSAKTHFNLAHASEKLGRFDAAANHYQEALRLNPRYPLAHFNLGIVLGKLGRPADAMDQYARELEVNPLSSDAHNNLATVLSKLGRLDEAVDHYQSAIRIKPDADNAYSNLAIALMQKGRLADAVDACMTALRINPRSPDAHNNLGRALESQGKTADAIAHYQEALRINPDFAVARQNLTRLHAGSRSP
jgi:tetratricopeptide (TPR) repeat protein